jgi:CRISPR-associated protein Csx14
MTAEWSVPVDLRNPGQVFACRGLVEAAEALLGRAFESRFAYAHRATLAQFIVSGHGSENPIETSLAFLRRAKVSLVVPMPEPEPALSAKQVPSTPAADTHVFPMRVPKKPASLPALLSDGENAIQLDSWADGPTQLGRDNVKFWAGARGYPGAALAHDALELIASMSGDDALAAARDPFAFSAPMTSSFRFDWRKDYIPLDIGFSLNKHKSTLDMVGYPLTEVFAAIGLQHARPQRPERRDKLSYRYGVSPEWLPTILARPVLGAADIGFPMRIFRIQLGWPGEENQARCIIDAREEVQT